MTSAIWVSDDNGVFRVHHGTTDDYYKNAHSVLFDFTVSENDLLYWISVVTNQILETHSHYTDAGKTCRDSETAIKNNLDTPDSDDMADFLQSSLDKAFDEKALSVLNEIQTILCEMYLKVRANSPDPNSSMSG